MISEIFIINDVVYIVFISAIILISTSGEKMRNASKDPTVKLLAYDNAKKASTVEQIEIIKPSASIEKIERTLLESIIMYIDIISQILLKSSNSFQSDLFQQVKTPF